MNNHFKIAFDISAQSIKKSGVGYYQMRLLKALIETHPENFYLLYGFNLRNKKRFKNLNFHAKNYRLILKSIPQRLLILWWMFFDRPRLDQLIPNCDLYHVSELCIPPVSRHKKTVGFVHDLTTLIYPQYHTKSNVFLHQKRFKKLNQLDAILTNSEYTKSDLIKHLKINEKKIFVTHLAADESFKVLPTKAVDEVLEKYEIKSPYILFVGTIEPRKNLIHLIKVYNQVRKNTSHKHSLILIGQKGWLYQSVFDEINQSPYRSDIKWMGYVEEGDLPAFYNGADFFTYPSFYEGFGLPVLEAMQCGTPVITSDVSAMPEVGSDACLYANPHSIDEWVEKLKLLITDSELKLKLCKKGLERASFFSWKKCAEETLRVYHSLR